MASVARAIEQAAPRTVDRSLWWESHKVLLEDMYAFSGESQIEDNKQRILEERLKNQEKWLLEMLLCFKGPNVASDEALKGSKVSIGSHSLDIKPDLKNTALQISKHLDLDEVQSYLLLTRYLEKEDLADDSSVLLQNVTLAYFLERESLIKCTRFLLTMECMSDKAQELIQMGLEQNILRNLKHIVSSTQLHQLESTYADAWAFATASEQTLLMDVLFLLYAAKLASCNGHIWKELLQTFQELVFEERSIERLAVTAAAASLIVQVRNQAVLVLIEALDLRTILTLVHGETPFSQGTHGFSSEDLQEVDALISGLDPSVAGEYAPLLLAWATFICLVSSLPDQAMVLDIEHAVYAQQAYKCGAYVFSLEILQSEQLKESDVSVEYKGAVKTLTSACLAAYDFCQAEGNIQEQIIQLLCEAFKGQETLCEMFWDKENIVDGPIRSFLFTLRDNFPNQMLQLLRLLSCLCEGAWAAECTFAFLYKEMPLTCLFRPNHDEESYGSVIHISIAIQVPNCSGLYIPAGAVGRVLKRYNNGDNLVRWQCEHSGFIVLLVYMSQWPGENIEEMAAIITLFNEMLSSNKVMSHYLLDIEKSLAAISARADGRMDKNLSVDVINSVCSVIKKLLCGPGHVKALADTVNLLEKFASSYPETVMGGIERTGLIPASGLRLSADQHFHLKFSKFEQSSGRYFLTIAVLNISISLLEKGICSEHLSTFVLYVMHNLLINHANWKYRERHERFQLSAKINQMLQVVIGRPVWDKNELRVPVLESLLNDTIIHGVLLQLLTVTAQNLEELYIDRRVPVYDVDALVQALCSTLQLIDTILLSFISTEFSTVPVFCQSLFQKSSIIASYLVFHRSSELQILSARILGKLCEIGQKAKPQAVNVASYLSTFDSKKQLRTFLEHIISEKYAFKFPDVFDEVMSFLTGAVTWQSGMVELLLSPWEYETVEGSQKKEQSEVLEAIWNMLKAPIVLSKRYLEIVHRLLTILVSVWQGATECFTAIQSLRSQNSFWDALFSRVSELVRPIKDYNNEGEAIYHEQAVIHTHCFRCQSAIYQLMAYDIFIQSRASGKGSEDNVLLNWIPSTAASDIPRSHVSYKFIEDIILSTKAEARTFIIGLVVKVMSGDIRGMNVSFVRHIQHLCSQISGHPAFKELYNEYTTRGYRYSQSVELLIMSDLYYNLQGENEGRRITNSSFQQLFIFLTDMELDAALISSEQQTRYDTKMLRAALGMDYWSENSDTVTDKTTEKILYSLEKANSILDVGYSHVSALNSFVDLLKFYSSEKPQATRGVLWTCETLSSLIEEVCQCLQKAVLGVFKDTKLYLPKYLAAQLRLLATSLRQLTNQPTEDISATCVTAIRACFTCMKHVVDFEPSIDVNLEECFSSLLVSLEFLSSKKSFTSKLIKADEVIRSSIPMLCSFVSSRTYRCLSLATINILIRHFLDSSTWLSILQKNFPTKLVINEENQDERTKAVIMSFNLYLSRFRGGAEMLFNAGFLHRMFILDDQMQVDDANYSPEVNKGPFTTIPETKAWQHNNLWSLGVATVASLLRSLGDDRLVTDALIAYFRAEKYKLISSISAPNTVMPKSRNVYTNSASLQEAIYVAELMCEIARLYNVASIHSVHDELAEVRETVVHLLAYIAREGLARSEGVKCLPVERQEVIAHGRPSCLGSTSAWFLVSAEGASVVFGGATAVGNEVARLSDSEYTEMIAIQVYKLVNVLLRFLVVQVRQALQDNEEGRSAKGFPELPAPEILHALQDQVMVVTTEIASSKVQGNMLDTCCMLFGVLEKCLYLEACVSRVCAITPASLRTDDFARQIKALLRATEGHSELKTSIAWVKEIAAIVYPGALVYS